MAARLKHARTSPASPHADGVPAFPSTATGAAAGGVSPGCVRCRFCCGCCGLPTLMFLVTVCAWSNVEEPGYSTPLGALVETAPTDPILHVNCDKEGSYDPTKPTVLFLHGYLGSSNDAVWVHRDPAFGATGLRFCSLDRPGYGWSQGYFSGDVRRGAGRVRFARGGGGASRPRHARAAPTPGAHATRPIPRRLQENQHFGKIAEITEAALRKAGVGGPLILLFHSLGGYHSLALAAQLRLSGASDMWLVGGVAVDAMTPRWVGVARARGAARALHPIATRCRAPTARRPLPPRRLASPPPAMQYEWNEPRPLEFCG